MQLYATRNGRRIALHGAVLGGGEIDFNHFQYRLLSSRNDAILDMSEIGLNRLDELSGWYKSEVDEFLVAKTSSGNVEALHLFINNYRDIDNQINPEAGKEYLKNLRFDSDGLATIMYRDCSGWSLLNAAAASGKPAVVEFLVNEVGMDVNTVCYGVTPLYCCFPSMHDRETNFNLDRLAAAQKFIEKGANLTHRNTSYAPFMPDRTLAPSGVSCIHTASIIKGKELRLAALNLLTDNLTDEQLAITDNSQNNALDYLKKFRTSEDTSAEEALLRGRGLLLKIERIGNVIRPTATALQTPRQASTSQSTT